MDQNKIDSLGAYIAANATVIPNNLNQGASIDAELLEKVSDIIELYAESYDRMERMYGGGNKVSCTCVAVDLRQNIIPQVCAAIEAARRTPAAATGDGELPPLPEPSIVDGPRDYYSAEKTEEIRLAAYQAGRQSLSESTSALVAMANRLRAKRDAEIADLRAQLAAKGQGEPVAQVDLENGNWMDVAMSEVPTCNRKKFKTRILYAAPASAQPADANSSNNSSSSAGAQPVDELDHGETVLRVQEALGITRTGWVSPDLILMRLWQLQQKAGAQPDQRESAAVPDEPPTFMTNEQAEKWAWEQVKCDVGTEGWTVGDSCNYFGFFLWGWRYRAQYERQRNVVANEIRLAAAPSQAAQPAKDEQWSKQPPTEQGEYWHWNGEEDTAPYIYHILWSGTAKKCFVSIGQYGIEEASFCDEFGGWWKKIPQPAIPQDSANNGADEQKGDA